MKVHITLVGGQPEPVYYGILHAQPEKILFVHSSDNKSKEYTDRIISMFPNIESEKKKFDPVNMDDIEKKVLACADKFASDEVTINISGGTKPWAYYFSNIFGKMDNCKLFYIDQKNTVWNLTDKSIDSVEYNMNVAIGLYGNEIAKSTNFKNVNKDDLNVVNEVEQMLSQNSKMFYALVANARRSTNQVEWSVGKSTLKYQSSSKSFEFFIPMGKNTIRKNISSPLIHNMIINTAWFEYEIAQHLSNWDKAIDIFMGCEFKFTNNSPKNEIDIIINIGTRLVFVECKTQIDSYTDIDKFRSAMRNFSGTSTIGLFVTREPMDDRTKEKCKDNDIMTFSVAECLARGKDVSKALLTMLDDKYNKINSK